ncbi:MAG: RdgB/HAM1 family non-canonical purine NTP pyrophosphatase [Bdellovibrionaceae bacterium]|nr:RdgB/HAM1 family non-canonical purine NTP pyrophosphatase [Pseudobdellovibrionaceae bacterium]
MELWLATGNVGKLKEYQTLLKEIPGLELHHQGEISSFTPRPEDGKTFLENARIKARSLRAVKPGVWILAEDSGLEVEGLGGLPGVHSARYAGPRASDSENIAKLLKMLQLRSLNRNAQFVATLVAITPTGEELTFAGYLKGQIAPTPRGHFGFGYDPIFIPEGQTQTLAELGPAYKNAHSHRSAAIRKFLAKLLTTN